MTEPIIVVDNVHKSYLMGKEAVPALRGVSVEVQPGEFVCLMGPSGSGKTTLLNIIGGLDDASRGHVIVEGENLVALSESKLAGQPVEITLKSYPNEPIEGLVSRVAPQAGELLGDAATFTVVIELDETDLDLLIGMTGRAEIQPG